MHHLGTFSFFTQGRDRAGRSPSVVKVYEQTSPRTSARIQGAVPCIGRASIVTKFRQRRSKSPGMWSAGWSDGFLQGSDARARFAKLPVSALELPAHTDEIREPQRRNQRSFVCGTRTGGGLDCVALGASVRGVRTSGGAGIGPKAWRVPDLSPARLQHTIRWPATGSQAKPPSPPGNSGSRSRTPRYSNPSGSAGCELCLPATGRQTGRSHRPRAGRWHPCPGRPGS
jgi:hypothetical protein